MSFSKPLSIDYKTQRSIIASNIAKMLIERGIITKNSNDFIQTMIQKLKDNDKCAITIDKVVENDSSNYQIIFLLEQKISTASKSSVIGDYLFKNINEHKIIIVDEILSRAKRTITEGFPLVEVFIKTNMMINWADCDKVPKHILLSDEESNRLLAEYGLQKREMPKILLSDPAARYYNAKLGQIFKIIRPSETSGLSNFYRIVSRDIVNSK